MYWAWPWPSEQDSVSPTVNLFHQETSWASYPYHSEGRQNENTIRKLIKLITWTTALSNSLKLWAMLCRATQDCGELWQNVVNREGNGKPHQYSCLENPMNSKKRQKDRTLKDELPRLVGANILLEISREITPERMRRPSQGKNNAQLCMWLVMEVKSDAVKNNIA